MTERDTGAEVSEPTADVLRDLLAQVPEQWSAVVEAVELSRRAGGRVIAVAGHQPGEGRTTLVRGLSLLLAERGWQVTPFATAAAWWRELVGDAATWQWQEPRSPAAADREIVLVDAGIWFPPGPYRPRQLLLTMFGYDAVLLVRHQTRPPCPARDRAIEQAGLRLVGEVVSFAADSSPRYRAA